MATIPASSPATAPTLHGDSIMLAEVLLDLAERAQAYTNAAGVAIGLLRGKELLVRTSTGAAPEVGTTIALSDSFVAECLRTRKPVTCRDADSDGRLGPVFRALNLRSIMAIPVCEVRDVRGMMLVLAKPPNAFQPTHISILMTLSDIVAAKLREHETSSVVEIPFFDEGDTVQQMAADPVSALSIFDPEPSSPFDLAMSAPPMPETASAFAAAAPIFSEAPIAAPPAVPAAGLPVTSRPAAEEPKPAFTAPEPDFFELPAETLPETDAFSPLDVAPPAHELFEPAALSHATPEQVRPAAMAPPAVEKVEPPPVTPPPSSVFTRLSVVMAAADQGRKSMVAPSPAAAAKPAVAPAPVKPPVATPPSLPVTLPIGSSPELPITPALAMMEEKFETAGHDPALLTPSEDPRRYRQQRSFLASTLGPTVSTTAATTTPRLTVKPFVVASAPAVAAAPVLPHPTPPAESMAASVSAILTSWDEPEEKRGKRSWIVAACAVAAALALAVGLWIHRAASVPGPAPVTPVPAVTAVALPPVAPEAAAPAVSSAKPAVTETKGERKLVAQETRAANDAPEEQPETPVMQIATGSAEPKPEPPAEVPAPKLNLSSGDTNIRILSRVSVAVPAAPKSHLVPPELVSQAPPVYPALARQLGIYGAVVLHVTINEDGSVGAVQVTDGAMQLRKAAVDAVRKWHYKPASLNGSPIEATAEVKVKFTK